jgi:hypothetical protein
MRWTFQSLIDGKMMLTAYCHNPQCNRHQVLNLEKLRDPFGPDAPAMADDITPSERKKFTVKKGDVWTCANADTTEGTQNTSSAVAIMRVIDLMTA